MWTSVIGLFFLCLDASYGYNLGYQYRLPSALSLDVGRIFQGLNRLSCSAMLDGETIAIKSKPYKRLETVDISSFTVGQQVNATVWKIMRFGVLLRTESGHEILVPNSQMTKAQLEKANQMLNSSEIFTIRLLTVDHVRGLLTGKFLSRSWKQSNVVKPLEGIDVEGRIFRGSVHAVYSYGVAVRIVDLGIDGIIPIASLPAAFRSKNLSSFFT